ncbi:MAG TPA: hypothetical protein P5519_03490 [Spirochaetia bacterium]|nr:hypothetical protein [Spirochaetales bacterium]HRS64932.1 hypothetical protein [Spirochaetia bacterium]HOT59456.1 hypothetical protein [Spirochaetales bacterium]HPD79515.1 hypothetical protein [Spirochaetales bacterium]HQG39954.1 hypothetical protein [Spirochaetales bacterium]
MNNVYSLLPPIRRIRGNRLYCNSGKRILDLYLDNGIRILSYKENKVKLYAKNAIEKGLASTYPGLYEARFTKALQKYLGADYQYLYMPNENAAMYVLKTCFNYSGKLKELWPLNNGQTDYSFSNAIQPVRIRPFLPLPSHCIGVFTVPGLYPLSFSVLLFTDTKQFETARDYYREHQELFCIAPLQYYAGARSIYSLLNFTQSGYNPDFWKQFTDYCKGIFINDGPYIYPACSNYHELFTQALACNVLLNPAPESPSIIPMEYSIGELKQFIANALTILNQK